MDCVFSYLINLNRKETKPTGCIYAYRILLFVRARVKMAHEQHGVCQMYHIYYYISHQCNILIRTDVLFEVLKIVQS